MKYKINKKATKIAGLLLMLIGLAVFLFPYYNIVLSDFRIKSRVEDYNEEYSSRRGKYGSENIIKESEKYNEDLSSDYSGVVDPFSVGGYKTYNKVMKTRDDVYGFIAIPRINEVLPIYLGADEGHLAKGAAQLAYTSLPIGGNSSRSVIAGHRGYYRQPMFRYLDKMKKGDKVYIYVFDRTLVYKVYSTEEIYPSENEKLNPIENKDIVTLLTCTPYPTNRKRLLVNCIRTDDEPRVRAGSARHTIDEDSLKENMDYEKADKKVLFTKALFMAIIIAGTIAEIYLLVRLIKTIFNLNKDRKNNKKNSKA